MDVGRTTAYCHGKIFTSDPQRRYADSFVVKDGFITWIGQYEDMPLDVDERVDLHGKCVIPGFVDNHMHPLMLAECIGKISCLPPKIHSIAELADQIAEEAREKADGAWIRGWGFDEEKFAEHRSPTRWDIDKSSGDHPVELLRSCTHIRTVNSKVLEMAGITRDTPDPAGGEIDRDENGEPTGLLKENARYLVNDVLPVRSREQVIDDLVALGELLLSQGVVAVCDMGVFDGLDYYDTYCAAAEKGMKQEVGMYYIWDFCRSDPKFQWTDDLADRRKPIHRTGIKLISDGSIGGCTAWDYTPYKGTDNCGISTCTDEEIDSAVAFCKEHQCQLSIHAMGGRAIDHVIKRVWQEKPWMQEAPHLRMEHITFPTEEALQKAAEAKIAFSTQMIFMYSEIESYLNNVGKERLSKAYPVRSILDHGIKTSLSTDAPATSWADPSDPFPNIKSAVTRRAYDGTDCGRENCIDTETAIEMYTREAAEIGNFDRCGQLKAGYKANFLILSDDIFSVPGEEIDRVCVEKTYVRGALVYEK